MSSTTKKTKRLSKVDPKEISLVPEGANNRKFLLFKEKSMTLEEILKSLGEAKIEKESEIDAELEKAGMCEDDVAAIKGALKLMGASKAPKELMAKLSAMAGYGPEKPKEDDGMDMKKELDAAVAELRKEHDGKLEQIKKEYDGKLELVQKASDEVKKQRDELATEVKKERDLRLSREFADKAKELGYAGEKAVEIANVLKSASEKMSAEEYKKIEDTLKSANAAVAKSELFKERGSSQSGGQKTADDKIAQAAEEIRKENPKLSKEQAVAEALDRNPSLYNEYLDANPKQGGY